jgi:anti-sigma factor RsiW
MSSMDEHAEISEQLVLFVAGALDQKTESRILEHTAKCPSCAAELGRWQLISGGLRRLPTPQPSPSLVARTRAMVAAQIAERAEQRQNRTALIFLALFSWVVTIAGWPVFRLVTGGLLSLLDIQFHQMWLLFAISSALAWLACGSAAVLLRARRQQERRFAL